MNNGNIDAEIHKHIIEAITLVNDPNLIGPQIDEEYVPFHNLKFPDPSIP